MARFRHIFLVAASSGEGLLTERRTAASLGGANWPSCAKSAINQQCPTSLAIIPDLFAGAFFSCTSWWRALVRWRTTDFSSRHIESNEPAGNIC
jgi:hypothetical protein